MKRITTFSLFISIFSFLSAQTYTYPQAYSWWSSSFQPDHGLDVAASDSLIAVVGQHGGSTFHVGASGRTTPSSYSGYLIVADTLGNYKPFLSKSFHGSGFERAEHVAIDHSGNVIVSGTFTGPSITTGSNTLNKSLAGNMAVFVVKYDVSGDYLWGKVVENDDTVRVTGMEVDSEGDIVLSGDFKGSDLTIGSNTLTNKGDFDGFVATIRADGDDGWGFSYGRDTTDIATDVYITSLDSVLVAGAFLSDTLFIESDTIANASTLDAFDGVIIKLDSAGMPVYTEGLAGPLDVIPTEVIGHDNVMYYAVEHESFYYGQNAVNIDVQVFRFTNHTFDWNFVISNAENEQLTDLSFTESGNIIFTGITEGLNLSLDGNDYTGNNFQDFFVGEINPFGNLVRAIRKGGLGNDRVNAFAMRGEDIWTVGDYDSDTLFLGADTLVNYGDDDILFGEAVLNNLPESTFIQPSNIDENSPGGTLIGTINVSDQDAEDLHTYYMDTTSSDNAYFRLNMNGELYSDTLFNFEDKNSYTINYLVFDSNGGRYIASSLISVNNVNEKPDSVTITNRPLNESIDKDDLIGTFSTYDPDSHPGGFIYSLVEGEGDADNGYFRVAGDDLYLADVFDYETTKEASIRIQTDDQNGEVYDTAFQFEIVDHKVLSTMHQPDIDLQAKGGDDAVHIVEIDEDANRYIHGQIVGEVNFQGNAFSSETGFFVAKYDASNNLQWIIPTEQINDMMVADTLYLLGDNDVFKIDVTDGSSLDQIPQGGEVLTIRSDTLYIGWETLSTTGFSVYTLGGNLAWSKSIPSDFYSGVYGIVADDIHVYLAIIARSGFTVDGVSFSQSYEDNNSFLGRIIATDRSATVTWGETFQLSPYQDSYNQTNRTYPVSVDLDSNGDVIYFGHIVSNENVVNTTLTVGSSGYTPYDEGFFARFNSSGVLMQVSFVDDFRSVQMDDNDNIYAAYYMNDINKYNAFGTFLWDADPGVYIDDIAVSGSEVVFGGNFTDFADFAGVSATVVGRDGYFGSYDNLGNETNIEYIGSDGGSWVFEDVEYNSNGNIVVLGSFDGNITQGNINLQSNNENDFFLMKYRIDSDTLATQWVYGYGAVTSDDVTSVAVDEAGNSYVIGTRPGTVHNEDTLFVQKVSADGDSLWTFEAAGFYGADQIEIDASGNIIFSGSFFASDVNIGGTTYSNTSSASRDVLIVKLLSDGTVSWAKQLFGFKYESIKGLETHGDSVYIAGDFESPTLTLNDESVNLSGNYDLYLAKLDHLGQNLFFKQYNFLSYDVMPLNGMMIFRDSLYIIQNKELTLLDLSGNILNYSGDQNNYTPYYLQHNQENIFLNKGSWIHEYNTELDFLRQFPTADYSLEDMAMSGDTLIQLFEKSIYQTIYREGPEGFSLLNDSIDENFTGFAGILEVENEPVSGTYEILSNAGEFSLKDDSLFVEKPFNYEITTDSMVSIRYTDTYGETLRRDLSLHIRDLNEAPEDIFVESFLITEEIDTAGTPVAYLSATDPDAGDAVSFHLPDSSVNDDFYIDGDTLRISRPLSYESFDPPSNKTIVQMKVYVEAVDNEGLIYLEEINSLEIEDINEMPYILRDTITYKQEVISPSGESLYLSTFYAIDEDIYGNYRSEWGLETSFSLPSDTGDNALFNIDNNNNQLYLLNDSSANYELDSLYQLFVKVNHHGDSVLLPHEVKIIDMNDPLDSAWISDPVAENVPVGTAVGIINWADADKVAGYKIEKSSSYGNSYFEIIGDTVYTAQEINYENSHLMDFNTSLHIVLTDTTAPYSPSYNETLNITILDQNDPPQLSLQTDPFEVDENVGDSTEVNRFILDDEDNDEVTLIMVSGDGDPANDHFTYDPTTGAVHILKPFNYEEVSESTIRLNIADNNGSSKDTILQINILDKNDLPYNIQLSDYSVPEVSLDGSDPVVGGVSFEDEDSGNSYNYSFAALDNENTDSDHFYWDDDTLRLENNTVDYEHEKELFIRISVQENTDDGSYYAYSDSIIIQLTDVNDEKPVIVSDQSFDIDEDAPAGSYIGTVAATDPDENTQFENWSFISGNDDDIFSIDSLSGKLFLSKDSSLNYTYVQLYILQVQVSDGRNISYTNAIDILINDVNFAPVVNDPIEDVEVAEGFDVYGINIYNMFGDKDGDELTYSAVSEYGIVGVEMDNANIYIRELSETASGTDSIIVTAEDDSGAAVSDKFAFVILPSGNTTGFDLFEGSIVSKIYPNPTDGKLWIEFESPSEDAILNVYNAIGKRLVQRQTDLAKQILLNIPGEPGLYFIEIATDETKEVFKVIKH